MTNSLIIGVVVITFSSSEDDLRDIFLQNVLLTTKQCNNNFLVPQSTVFHRLCGAGVFGEYSLTCLLQIDLKHIPL